VEWSLGVIIWAVTRKRLRSVLVFVAVDVLVVAALAVLLLVRYGALDDVGDAITFEPVRGNSLTVATTFPAAGFWEGSDVDHVTGGMEYELARELADHLDLRRVEVVQVSFEDLVRGDADDFDLALAQISVTEQRERDVELSETYLTTPVGVVGRTGTEADDLATARELRWGVGEATTQADLVEDKVRPEREPRTYRSTTAALEGLAKGEVDLVAADYIRALAEADAAQGDLALVAQIDEPQYYAALLPKDSANLEPVNAAIRDLRASGTLGELQDALYARFHVDPDSVPTIGVAPSAAP
jgi:polar amino acid transport system substrate-binding protein